MWGYGAANIERPAFGQPELVLYYHQDHLGSTQYLTDQCAVLVEHSEYLPNGQSWINDQSSDPNANNPNSFDPASQYRFTGKEQDPETGFYYYGARYFDPKAQIWLSPDPILDQYLAGAPNGGVFTPVNLALYSYAANNPIRYVDPDGRAVVLLGIPLVEWALGGLTLTVSSCVATNCGPAIVEKSGKAGPRSVTEGVVTAAAIITPMTQGALLGPPQVSYPGHRPAPPQDSRPGGFEPASTVEVQPGLNPRRTDPSSTVTPISNTQSPIVIENRRRNRGGQGQGERKQTAKPLGTPHKDKHLKWDEKRQRWFQLDADGKRGYKPEGYLESPKPKSKNSQK